MFPTTSSSSIDWNAYAPAPTTPAKPVGALSSQAGLSLVNQNTQKLTGMEQPYTVSLYDQAAASQAKTTATAPVAPATPAVLRNVSTSPASNTMTGELNGAMSNGGMTAAEKASLDALKAHQDEATAAAAKARAALSASDYTGMNQYVKSAEASKTAYETGLADFYKQMQPLRDQYTSFMTPTDKETQLGKQLTDIRGQADAFALQTEQDKFEEYQGQTMGFAGGRASEIDIKASFKNQELALKEKNLLASLGLEQDARKTKLDATGNLITNLKDDFELQTKVQDKLDALEESIFTRADKLQTDSKNTLISILDQLSGVDPATLPEATKQNLEDLAARANLPLDLVTTALKTQYDKQTFDDALKSDKVASDKKQQAFDNGIKLAQLAIDQQKARSDTSGITDPSQVLAYAQQYASDGKIPTGLPKGSFGIVSQVAKELPKPTGTLVDINTGIKPGALSPTQEDGIVAARDLITKLDDLKTDYDATHTGLIAGIKNAVLPSDTNQRFNDMRTEIIDLLARARTGAVIGKEEERTYAAKLPNNFSNTFFLGADGDTKIADLKKSLQGKLDTTLQTQGVAIYGYSKINLGGHEYTVGQIVPNAKGQLGRVNADGTITLIQQ